MCAGSPSCPAGASGWCRAKVARWPSSSRGEITLVVGAEREGLPDSVLAECDELCHIPIRSESLNAAMAATVAMYEVSR